MDNSFTLTRLLTLQTHPADYRAVRGDAARVSLALAKEVDTFVFVCCWVRWAEGYKLPRR